MNSAGLRKRVTQSLLDDINDVQFPSVTMMNRVESTLATQDDLADYVEALVEKVEATRYPSISMLNRIDGLLDQLERSEQQEAAQSDGGEQG